jgi:hypothetical protein
MAGQLVTTVGADDVVGGAPRAATVIAARAVAAHCSRFRQVGRYP